MKGAIESTKQLKILSGFSQSHCFLKPTQRQATKEQYKTKQSQRLNILNPHLFMNSSARWFNSKMQKYGICFFSLLGLVVSLRSLPKPLKRRRLRKPWGLWVLLGIGGRLRITTDDDESTPMHLNQWREAKERMARGLCRVLKCLQRQLYHQAPEDIHFHVLMSRMR